MPVFGWSTALTLIIYLVKIRVQDYQNKGSSSYGKKKANLIITESGISINNVEIHFTQMKNLVIYVDEYFGMPKHYILRHHGGNNEIRFEHNGRLVSFNYLISSEKNYRLVEKLVQKIEAKYPPLKH